MKKISLGLNLPKINMGLLSLPRIDLDRLFQIDKGKLSLWLFYLGILVAFMGSLNPWPMWPIGSLYELPAGALCGAALLIGAFSPSSPFTNRGVSKTVVVFVLLIFYMSVAHQENLVSYICHPFRIVLFLSLFMFDKSRLIELSTLIAKVLAVILAVSIIAYIAYLVGVSMPSRSVVFKDGLYTYSNYYFFLLDDRFMTNIYPRFHSIFLEPGHLGMMGILVLLSQCGFWNRWYNIIIYLAVLMSFSLAAYVMLVVLVFANLWLKGRNIVMHGILLLALIVGVGVGSIYYNGGDNLVNNLIMLRLEVEDGEVEGDNRVTEDFQSEFDRFLSSSDLLWGRTRQQVFGDSGYRVFIYENGLIGLALLLAFYFMVMSGFSNIRCWLVMGVFALMLFVVRGFMLWPAFFIPLYCIDQARHIRSDYKKRSV